MTVSFIPYQQLTKVNQTTYSAFNIPAALKPLQCWVILYDWFCTVFSMRIEHLFHLTYRKLSTHCVAVCGIIVNQTIRVEWQNSPVRQIFNQSYLYWRDFVMIQKEKEPVFVDQKRTLSSLFSFRPSDIAPSFFIEQNITFPNVSEHTTSLQPSNCLSNCCPTSKRESPSICLLVQYQQALSDSRSIHQALVLNSLDIPWRYLLGVALYHPLTVVIDGSGNKPLMTTF